jgi:GNAT superfamily N-acetyltransferase
MLKIRAAAPGDGATIHELVAALAEYERLAHEIDATATHFEAALFGPSPRVFCDIAEWHADGACQAAGLALWFYNFSTFRGRHGIYLEDLFVRPEHRGRGIGRALLAGLARRCVAESLGRLEWSVLNWNTPAIEFYRSLGAQPMDGWTVYRLTGAPLAQLGATDQESRSGRR